MVQGRHQFSLLPFNHPGGTNAASSTPVCKHPDKNVQGSSARFIIIGHVNVTQICDFLRWAVSSKSNQQRSGDETEWRTLCVAVSGQGRPCAVICHCD